MRVCLLVCLGNGKGFLIPDLKNQVYRNGEINDGYDVETFDLRDTNMDKFDFLIMVMSFPIVFMIHDFEEIIFLKPWIRKNKAYLSEKFPELSKRIFPRYLRLSTSAFTLAVAEEFVLLSGITFGSVYFDIYYLWLAAFIGFFIHLVGHIVQWMIVRKYIPVIVTTLLVMPYCVYVWIEIIKNQAFQFTEIGMCAIIGVVLVGINMVFAHKLAHYFDQKQTMK